MPQMTTCLWFDGQAEDAARFYADLFPGSRIDNVVTAPAENPATQKGSVLMVEFTLFGQSFLALNGGAQTSFNEAVSFMVPCADQADVDRYWQALTADGGGEIDCGWVHDRFGVRWQVVPTVLTEMIKSDDRAAAERTMQAMMTMVKMDIAALEAAFRGE